MGSIVLQMQIYLEIIQNSLHNYISTPVEFWYVLK